MRAVLVAAIALGAPALARAEAPQPLVVWHDTVVRPEPGVPLTAVSHTLYLNNCLPNGCTVSPGQDNSLTNRSSIVSSPKTLDAWSWGDQAWLDLVACVKETFLPFDIQIVTADPGQANHFEVMVGGSSTQLDPMLNAGGVAPFIGCNATRNNAISFVFAAQTGQLPYLCAAVAQEASHIWGLDHELNAKDPMTYLDLGSSKRFQLADAECGEALASPRRCKCGGSTQNSFKYLSDTFGMADLPPAVLAVATPSEGEWLKPGFPIRAQMTTVLGVRDAAWSLDGVQQGMLSQIPYAWNAPANLAGGDHTVMVTATDAGARTDSVTIHVHVTAACGAGNACAQGLHCLGGSCLPGESVEGGLGASCTANDACITGTCGTNGDAQRCTAACDPGNICPAGFSCLGTSDGGGGGVCWPDSTDAGGCDTSGRGSPLAAFAGLGLVLLVTRRRR